MRSSTRPASPIVGQPSAPKLTGTRNVSRPRWCRRSCARTPSSTAQYVPSASSTMSAWPVAWIGWSRAIAVGDDRVARERFERSGRRCAARDDLGVVVRRPALRGEQVVAPRQLVDVRALRPDAARPFPDRLQRLAQRARPEIDARLVDARMVGVGALAVAQVIDVAVGEQQRRVEAVGVEPDRIRPRPARVLGGDEEVSAAVRAIRPAS